jgi:hypothetical protein
MGIGIRRMAGIFCAASLCAFAACNSTHDVWRASGPETPWVGRPTCPEKPEIDSPSVRRGVLMVVAGASRMGVGVHAVDTATDTVFTEYAPLANGLPVGFAARVSVYGAIEIGPLPGSPEYTGRLLAEVAAASRVFTRSVMRQRCVPTPDLEAIAAAAGVVLPADFGAPVGPADAASSPPGSAVGAVFPILSPLYHQRASVIGQGDSPHSDGGTE